jgi:hypothetical protein
MARRKLPAVRWIPCRRCGRDCPRRRNSKAPLCETCRSGNYRNPKLLNKVCHQPSTPPMNRTQSPTSRNCWRSGGFGSSLNVCLPAQTATTQAPFIIGECRLARFSIRRTFRARIAFIKRRCEGRAGRAYSQLADADVTSLTPTSRRPPMTA